MSDSTDSKVIALLSGKEKEVKKHFYDAIIDIAAIASHMPYMGKIFKVSDYPPLEKRITTALNKLHTEIEATVVSGAEIAWQISDQKNKIFVDKNFKNIEIPPEYKKVLYDSNTKALEAFKDEKVGGLGLSERIWNGLKPYNAQLEQDLALGIANGESADAMARRMQKYLLDPDGIRKRIIDQNKKADEAKAKGVKGPNRVKLRKAIRDYNPGKGIYKSAYKNALRLTREQINRAYRTADHDRWASQGFVVGIEISLSNSHKKHHGDEPEMCELLVGFYPKDFFWVGWHIQCMCHGTPITLTSEEMEDYTLALVQGREWKGKSKNGVYDIPEKFKTWYEENKDRLNGLKSIPTYVYENMQYLEPK